MKQLILTFFLAAGVINTTLLYSIQENSMANKILDNQRIYDDYDNNTNPIMCDENDQEVCDYIEQQKESDLRIWLRELEIILFLKLIYLKECLEKYKKTVAAWLKKLIVMSY